MSEYDLVVRGRLVALPDGARPAAVAVRGGRIARVAPAEAVLDAAEDVDAGEALVLPGGVDTHVHVNDPGRADWEGWETATLAAAAGGVTTIVDMPLNSIPATTTVEALEVKRRAAEGRAWVDYGLWGGVVPGNAAELAPLLDRGALGFKAFMVDSGVPEFPASSDDDLRAALAVLAPRGAPLLVHAEDAASLRPEELARKPASYGAWLRSRPGHAEGRAVERLASLAAETGGWVHVVHVSASQAVDRVARARSAGLRLTAETCPHYLRFTSDPLGDGDTLWKCAPPIRDASHRERLWRALADGTLDLVASDHSPCPPSMKEGDFATAWGGIASLQLARSVTWTGMLPRSNTIEDFARWTSAGPARLAGIDDRKGAIAPGLDADLVVLDPLAEFEVLPENLQHRHAQTPYLGARLSGRVLATYLRGRLVYAEAAWAAGDPIGVASGRWLRGRRPGP